MGHNWGSNHDLDTTECNPPFSENGGKFIMYPSVLGGNEPNNKVNFYVIISMPRKLF